MTSPEHSIAAARVAALVGKAIVGPVREYEVALERMVNRALSQGMTAAEFRADHKALLREFATPTFLDGLRAGGVDEMDEDDDATVAGWLQEQLQHVNDFAKFVTAARKLPPDERAQAEREAIRRLVLWVRAMEMLRALGLASAKANMMVTWRVGDTEHCATCASLNGKRRRWKWFTSREYIPQQPGSDTLECGGYNCQCVLRDDKGKQVMP